MTSLITPEPIMASYLFKDHEMRLKAGTGGQQGGRGGLGAADRITLSPMKVENENQAHWPSFLQAEGSLSWERSWRVKSVN